MQKIAPNLNHLNFPSIGLLISFLVDLDLGQILVFDLLENI